jgi:hypothetical protein
MKKLMIMLATAFAFAATAQAQNNNPGSPVINGSGTYSPQMNPGSGQSNVVVGQDPNLNNTTNTTGTNTTVGTPNSNGSVQNGVSTNTNAYRTTPSPTGTGSDSLSQFPANTPQSQNKMVTPAIGTQSGTINQPAGSGSSAGNATGGTGTVATPPTTPPK